MPTGCEPCATELTEGFTIKTLRDPGGDVSAVTAPLHRLLRQAEAIQARQVGLTDKQRELETSVRRARGHVGHLRRASRAASRSVSGVACALRAASWRLDGARASVRHRRARLEPLWRRVSWARSRLRVVVERLPSEAVRVGGGSGVPRSARVVYRRFYTSECPFFSLRAPSAEIFIR